MGNLGCDRKTLRINWLQRKPLLLECLQHTLPMSLPRWRFGCRNRSRRHGNTHPCQIAGCPTCAQGKLQGYRARYSSSRRRPESHRGPGSRERAIARATEQGRACCHRRTPRRRHIRKEPIRNGAARFRLQVFTLSCKVPFFEACCLSRSS